MCSLAEAVDSAKEHFNREKGLEAAHYYLTPVYTEAPFLLSDAGLQAADGTTMAIGVVALGVNPMDNTVNLTASDGQHLPWWCIAYFTLQRTSFWFPLSSLIQHGLG